MTNEQILEKQVEALEKLLQIKQAIIEEHEAKIGRLEAERYNIPNGFPGIPWTGPGLVQPFMPLQHPINVPSVWTVDPCTDGGLHDYPFPWNSTSPPSCKKCGKMGHQSQWTVTSGTTTTLQNNPNDADDSNNVLTLSTAAGK